MESLPASVLEALDRAHVTLLEDLRRLEEAARPQAPGGLAPLRARLGATRNHIAQHFRFEEQGGYLDVVRQREPRLERAVAQLAEEHRKLLAGLDGLIREVAAGPPDVALSDQVRAWVEQVRHHEAHENEVVQDAFNLDLGAED
jgi:hypothetical protein